MAHGLASRRAGTLTGRSHLHGAEWTRAHLKCKTQRWRISRLLSFTSRSRVALVALICMPVLFWFRRDLRLTDNTGLFRAAQAGPVIPVYLLSAWHGEAHWTGPKRQHFLCESLRSLAANLAAQGSALLFRSGEAVAALEALIVETGATGLFFNAAADPAGRLIDLKVKALCARLGLRCESSLDHVLHGPEDVLTGEGRPYRVFTPFAKNWSGLPKPNPVPRATSWAPVGTLQSLPVPTVAHWGLALAPDVTLLPGGERAARDRMKAFIRQGRLQGYAQHRDTPEGETTSGLSQDLRFGLISIRELYHSVQQAGGESAQKFLSELAWREFYAAILFHWPEVLEHEFSPDWRGLSWPGTEEAFTAWCTGRTGYPLVDAGLRQLLATGLMHNRVRMIVAMFLTKDLHCDWRWGEQFFCQQLIDAEIASNNGGWQWSAGTGADAAPYFRIQNPWLQTQRYDPEGRYIKRWLPELNDIPAGQFSAPPRDGRPLAPGYPRPLVDHATERAVTLSLFAQHKARR
jgi:deoxyribodipyrimidine photo-lyase